MMGDSTNRRKALAAVTAVVVFIVAMLAVSMRPAGQVVIDPALNGMDMLRVDESSWRDGRTGEPKPPTDVTVWDVLQSSAR